MKEENIFDPTPTGFGAAESKVRPEGETLKSVTRNYCFIQDISFNDLEDECEFAPGSVRTIKVSRALTDPPYNIRSARGRSNSAHNLFSKRNMGNAM